MADAFDAYHEWLGIPPEEQPADYYRLLGVTRFEAKPSVIEHAADRQMAHVRSLQTGKHGKESQKLLNQIASAKICLLDPERKEDYDTQLRASAKSPLAKPPVAKRSQAAKPAKPPKPPAPPPPVRRPPVHETRAADTTALVTPSPPDSGIHSRRRKKKSALWMIGLVLGLVVALGGALVTGAALVLSGKVQLSRANPQPGEDDPAQPRDGETTVNSGDVTEPGDGESEGNGDSPVEEATSDGDPADEPTPDEPPDPTGSDDPTGQPAPDGSDQPEAAPQKLEPQPGSGSVDVLAAADPARHGVSGQWSKTNGRLTANAVDGADRATIELPVVVPDAYELKLAVTRKAGGGPLEMSLPLGEQQRARLYLDREGTRTGLEGNLNQGDTPLPSSERPALLLPIGETKLIICRLRSNEIRMTVDGDAVVDWQREVDEASLPSELPGLSGAAAYLAAEDASFQFDVLQLTALAPDGTDPEPGFTAPPMPIARWTFNGDLSDEIGGLDGTAVGAAELRNGRLRLDGRSYVFTAPIDRTLTEKTLEVWLELASTAPPESCVMGISQEDHTYNAIAYAGPLHKQWGHLSRLARQIQPLNGPEETTPPGELIHLAFVYQIDGSVVAYRNGAAYGPALQSGTTATFDSGMARVFFGRAGRNLLGEFVGYIDQAQLFDRALSAEQVAELAAEEPAALLEQLIAVPDADARQAALDRLRGVYKQELAENDLAEKQMFARRLIRLADQTDDPVERFAVLELARDVFANAGDLEEACQVIEKLADQYDIDAPSMQLAALPIAAPKAKGVQLVSVARRADRLFAEAVRKEDFEAAEQILRMAQSAAKKTEQTAIAKRCVRNQVWLRKYEAAAEKYREAQAVLSTSPDDSAANQTVGTYLCFVKGDWPKGLPFLVRGDDDQLRTLAEQETAGAVAAEEQLDLGNGWWKAAEKAEDHLADALRDRAAKWYRLAVPHLSGVDQTEAQRHLQELTMAENDGWLVLFRAASVSYWNTKVSDEDAYAVPLDSVKQEVKFLRIQRTDTNHFVIVPMNLQTLTRGGPIAPTLLWRNASPHIGIASSRLPVDRGEPWIAAGATRKTAYGGWGFGEIWGDVGNTSCWQGQTVTGVTLEIAVKSAPLTRTEQLGLLR
jgi:hypothetical protein